MKKYLFVDTESTGLPKSWNAPASDTTNWPRMVQIAWIINNENGEKLTEQNHIIKPEGFIIPEEVSKLHGITTERALAEGESLKKTLRTFAEHLVRCDYVVAHNIAFDEKIIEAEMIRLRIPVSFQYANKICTMKQSVNFCSLPGNKWPKLQELHIKLFDESFDDAHNALSDITATARCFWELKNRNIINL